MDNPAYTLKSPENPRSCVVFNSPHSGAVYPAEFLAMTRLNTLSIRSSEDAFVDELFADAPKFGAPLLAAKFPRAYVDLNRRADEMDPALVRGVRYAGTNARISAGLGVIPRVVARHQVIRSGKISKEEAAMRIAQAYDPYHARLAALLDAQRAYHGAAVLIDCHSMPFEALATTPPVNNRRPDVVLGDCFGVASAGWITDLIAAVFTREGFTVARNAPFSGGYITRHYGRPSQSIHAVQIEVDRSLYMDESRITRRDDFVAICAVFSRVTEALAAISPTATALAAE